MVLDSRTLEFKKIRILHCVWVLFYTWKWIGIEGIEWVSVIFISATAGAVIKNPTTKCRRWKRQGFYSLVRKKPWSRKWQPSSVFLLRTFHGERSLAGYCPWGQKESDMTEWLSTHMHIHCSLCACVLPCFSGAPLFADPMDCSSPGSSVHGILQERILERVTMLSSQGSFWARDRTCLFCDSCTAGGFFSAGPPGKTTPFFISCYTPYENLWMTPKSR